MKQKKFESMGVVNPFAAEIAVGSKSNYLAMGQDPKEDVKEFGVYSQDHELMIGYLRHHGITTVAM